MSQVHALVLHIEFSVTSSSRQYICDLFEGVLFD